MALLLAVARCACRRRCRPPLRRRRRPTGAATLTDAYRLFYNAHYEEAAALALTLRVDGHAGSRERRSPDVGSAVSAARPAQRSGRAQGDDDKDEALKRCAQVRRRAGGVHDRSPSRSGTCARLLKAKPDDEDALFFLGKLDLNYVWLQLGLLGHKTGWDEYWEARKSLDAVLKLNPEHVRARVARGWIDYIVNTRMPWGTRWLLGGGNKKRGIAVVREAATMEADSSRAPRRSSRCGTCTCAKRIRRGHRARAKARAQLSRQPGSRAGIWPDAGRCHARDAKLGAKVVPVPRATSRLIATAAGVTENIVNNKHGREDGQTGAGQKRRVRRDARPDRAEDQARGERADAERRVVDAKRRAARVRGRHVGHPRLFVPFRQARSTTRTTERSRSPSACVSKNPNPAYTNAYQSQPSAIRPRRPNLSDSAPPTSDDTTFTTCSADQRRGIHTVATPRSLSRSSRNASLALPSEKRE